MMRRVLVLTCSLGVAYSFSVPAVPRRAYSAAIRGRITAAAAAGGRRRQHLICCTADSLHTTADSHNFGESDRHALFSKLLDFGFSQTAASAVAQHSAGFPENGVNARMAQLQFGVDKEILSAAEACGLVTEQPDFFNLDFRTAHEDSHVVAVSKPWDAQLAYTSRADNEVGERWAGELTLRGYLEAHHTEVLNEKGEVRLCHQLDFATSGLIVSAKSRESADAVARCFRDRVARKLYAALVFGHPPWDTCVWDARIQPSKKRFKQRVSSGGKSAETHVTVACRGKLLVGEHAGKDASLLWLEPKTGRRHQLRVHASHAGYPIVGDLSYANDRLMYRMFLHASALALPLELPEYGNEELMLESPLDPVGWAHVFQPNDELMRSPDGWPAAVERIGALHPNLDVNFPQTG